MYVCICNAVTESEIRQQAELGVRDFATLQARTGCSTTCGCCESLAREVLAKAVAEAPPLLRIVVPQAA